MFTIDRNFIYTCKQETRFSLIKLCAPIDCNFLLQTYIVIIYDRN